MAPRLDYFGCKGVDVKFDPVAVLNTSVIASLILLKTTNHWYFLNLVSEFTDFITKLIKARLFFSPLFGRSCFKKHMAKLDS